MQPALSLHSVSKTFHDTGEKSLPVLRDISLEIGHGEWFVLLGPSGSGKSTLLRIMSGLETATHGQIQLDSDLTQKDFAFVFQQFGLFPWMTVYENVELGLIARDLAASDRKTIVVDQLRQFGLEHFADTRPKSLSGGMRQRVGLARALAVSPKVLFMDEPFSELDSFTAEELRKDMLKIWEQRKMTVVMVTHIIPDAIELADRIAVMTPRPGRIERIIANDLPRPRDRRSPASFALEDQLISLVKP